MKNKPKLYIHVKLATHFLKWELKEFAKFFELVNSPSEDVPMLAFGPDVLEEASTLPALKRFAVLFPGFSHNPVYNLENRKLHRRLIEKHYCKVFINPGPLEIAYKGLKNIEFYPFSVDTSLVKMKRPRKQLNSLLHLSNESPQKDWERSEEVMQLTGLRYEVFPPRDMQFYRNKVNSNEKKNKLRKYIGLKQKNYLPFGYVSHEEVLKKYRSYDGFVHVAKDIKDPIYIDGKYTASFIEAGVTGAILFWHDTFGLGNHLKTVFSIPLDPKEAAEEILRIRSTIDIEKHSRLTSEEMISIFNPYNSVSIRAKKILESI